MKKNILITGGAGFIGSHTYVVLKENGFTPIIVDNFSNSSIHVIQNLEIICQSPVVYYHLDVNDPKTYDQVFKEHEIDGVIHVAAFPPLLFVLGKRTKRPKMCTALFGQDFQPSQWDVVSVTELLAIDQHQ